MLNEPKVNEKTQEDMNSLLGTIIDSINHYSMLFESLNIQEKTLAGGIVFGMFNPWSDTESYHCVGTKAMVPAIIGGLSSYLQGVTFKKTDTSKLNIDPKLLN